MLGPTQENRELFVETKLMTKLLMQRVGASALVVGLGLILSGCATCKPGKAGPIGKYSIETHLDPSLKDASVTVDIVGATPLTLPRWENYSMKKYWEPQDEMREGAEKITFTLGNGADQSHTIPMDDPKWKDWAAHGVTYIVVVADLPGVIDDKVGSLDARRQELPLDQCSWTEGTTNLVVDVKRSGLEVRSMSRQYR
jgi:hypothetical protein